MKIPKSKFIEIYNEEYLNGTSVSELAIKYDLTKQYIYRWFYKLNLPLRSNQINSKKYHFNENYFENIDSSNKAYWLGFIYADGYITSKRKHCNRKLGISLNIRDIDHLKKLNKCLESDVSIRCYQEKSGYAIGATYCRVLYSNKKITDDLIELGVYERKTNILKPPQIKEKYIKDFIRGYFDGDGSVWFQKSKDKKPQASVSFVGTDDLLIFIQNHLIDNNIIKHPYKLYKRKSNQIVSSFKFGGNIQTYKFLEYIYINSEIYLDRKYNIYLNFEKLQQITSHPIQ